MALPGKENPFAKGLTEKAPVPGTKAKKSFVKIPLSTGEIPKAPEVSPSPLPRPSNESSAHAESTGIQSTEIKSTGLKSTEIKSTGLKSTEIKSTGLKSTESELPQFQSTELRSTEIQSTESRLTEERRGGEAPEPIIRTSGYFQLNYSALELMRRLEAGEFVVFQFLTLKAWGWNVDKHRLGSGLVRAAGTYVSQSLGIAKSSADKYLGRLAERGLLTLVEKSHKRGNTYRVSPLLTASNEKTESRSTEIQTTSSPKNEQLVDRSSVSSSPKNEQLVDRSSVKLIDSKKVNTIYLSQERPSAWIEFTAQLTEKGRERAERVFQNLKNQFPADPVNEIAEAPKNLERFGAPDGTPWGQISSPIGLMESSWPQLREFFRKRVAETLKSNHARERIEAERIKAAEQDRLEAEQSQRRREAFFVAFQDEQGRREVIHKYLVGLPFKPDGQIGQNIAIAKWWEERTGAQQVTQGIMTSERERAEIRAAIEQSIGEGKS